ncbi:hypothetical protein RND71_000949 [Anisodus tanguticus]|uniref:Uncharacterized protein n=1 Tax=Anisodus tanguticus TaxID=243964 RepID=A0AAE1VRT0_9SOLA|nr:hypothetical protein RND71_000949 [Anisodus tanguticus]
MEPGPDLRIKCLHSTFVIDPLTGKEAEFSLDQSCIDIEKLLLRVICCNRYARLLEIFKELEKNGQICRVPGDVQLQCHVEEILADSRKKDNKFDSREYQGQEVLRLRAFGSSFFTLAINIRNGHFILHSSKKVISSSVVECEEALNQGSMLDAEAFISLRSKSILHLFVCIGRFLGLEVFEHGSAAVKVPKSISCGTNLLLMGFPECGSSYFLLMELDKDFKPVFKLLESQSDSPAKAQSLADLSNVVRVKTVDIGRMQICEDELNLSLLNNKKLLSVLPSDGGSHQSSENSLLADFSLEGSIVASSVPSTFCSIVDEVVELEKGSSVPSFSGQIPPSTFGASPASHFGSGVANYQSLKVGTLSPKWDRGAGNYSSSMYKGVIQAGSAGSLAATPGRSQTGKKLTASKSEQDLTSLRSPHSAGVGSYTSLDEDQLTVSTNRSARLLSPPQQVCLPASGSSGKASGPRNSAVGTVPGGFRTSESNSLVLSPGSQAIDSATCTKSEQDAASRYTILPRKRRLSDLLDSLPSLQAMQSNEGSYKRRKLVESASTHLPKSLMLISSDISGKTEEYSYGSLIAEANKGNAPSSIYVSSLLHVVRHCSLCIKHARLTSQMEALDIPYVEEVGRPGSTSWDVKINDQHFQDLWELQKGSNSTPWGSGIRIANTSDAVSHIRYDSEGVVLSYYSVNADSIKKLVADIQRLSNARTFALGMRKLLGARADEKFEENIANSESKASAALKGASDATDRISEQMRKQFRIEAVGLMSLWFSFGSGLLGCLLTLWLNGNRVKRAAQCMFLLINFGHIQASKCISTYNWPSLESLNIYFVPSHCCGLSYGSPVKDSACDFINGAEVASLLDCIRLTAGPLHALAAATQPARAAPVSGVPGVTAPISSVAKQSSYVPSLPSNVNSSINQPASGPGQLLAAVGRGGPGIVPSSLLPIDVSVVLRGPYWIRIIYRKKIAVDMRCFAGDQVWLQPATPPKRGPEVEGSLPCPQFRPFIMEHVAQELNGIDSNFTGSQQAVGLTNSNSLTAGSQLPAANTNRTNLSNSTGLACPANTVTGFNRAANGLPAASNLAGVNAGIPLCRPPGTGVPAHVRGELNTAIIGLGDDGGYGGGWVPLVALKKVLRGILKYLGVLWLFAQLPDLLKEILGSILKDNEGALLNLDQEQPALRFFVGGYVFAVSVHRVQLLLQVISVKRFHQSQQQQQQNPGSVQEELTQSEIGEICDYFSCRVASEPCDASRVASFITLLTLPISVLREFLKLIAWKKGLSQVQGENTSASKSNIHYDRAHNSVDFALTVVLDHAHIPHINAAGGAAWLPYCVPVRLRYAFGENPNVLFLGMEGSHGGRACWLRVDDWERCKQRVARTVGVNGNSAGDANQGRLRVVADGVQRTLHAYLRGLRDGGGVAAGIGS